MNELSIKGCVDPGSRQRGLVKRAMIGPPLSQEVSFGYRCTMKLSKGFAALILGLSVTLPAVAAAAIALPDFSQLKVYGVNSPGLGSVSEAKTMLEQQLSAEGQLSPADSAELHRFLVYDALNHYVAFLLHVTAKPDSDYLAGFAPLQEMLGADFSSLQYDAMQKAVDLAQKIRFDVTMVMRSTKQIYNTEQGSPIDAEIVAILSRLEKTSTQLSQLYPAGNGELPTSLIAFVVGVFAPKEGDERATCDQHLPEQLKTRVLDILATSRPEPLSPVLASPVKRAVGSLEPSQ